MAISKSGIRPWMLKKEMIVLYYALRDKRTTLIAKLPAILSIFYLFSPIDFIPDFIPFLGYLDDILIVPLMLDLSIRLLPRIVREESMRKAELNKKKFRVFTIVAILIIILLVLGIFFLIRHLFSNR